MTRITNDELERCRLNVPRCTKRGITPLMKTTATTATPKLLWSSISSVNSFSKFFSIHLDNQARVVRKVDDAVHRINQYPADSVVCFVNTYPLANNLSGE